jgi:AraC-like DNA-binding protein
MHHAEYPAPPEMAHLVRCVWVFEGRFDEPHDERIVPDGCPELILHFGAPYRECDLAGRWRTQPRLFVAGNLTRALLLRAQGMVGVLGVRLWPQAISRFTSEPASATLDRRIALPHRHASRWQQTLADAGGAPDDEPRRALVPTVVAALASRLERSDAVIDQAVATLFASRGQATPESLARDAGLSMRQLQRRLFAATGLGPKSLASLVRFRAVFDELQADAPSPWLAAALAAGYFDQAHMIRAFRRYAGQPPRAYLASAGRLSTALVSTSAR